MDVLTDDQLTSRRLALLALEQELESLHEASAEGAAPVDLDQPIGRLSRMDAMQQQRMLQANRAAMQRRLQQVRAALRRLDEDEYGVCVTCGEGVGFPRLEAQPEAPFCIACQSARERRD
jgi:DnaK suppressor protein